MTLSDSGPGLGLDTRVPATARIYDFLLRGKDNFCADRDAGRKIIALVPDAVDLAVWNRQWAARAAKYCVRSGIKQVVDLGVGYPCYPTSSSVFEAVRIESSAAVVVVVDSDPIVLVHNRAMLHHDERVTIVEGDLRKPGDILHSLKGLIDFEEPVAVIMAAVLHFVTDAEDPAGIVAPFFDALAPGSHIAVSHATSTGLDSEVVTGLQGIYADASSPFVIRAEEQIVGLFGGLEIVSPGVVDAQFWYPDQLARHTSGRILAGVGRVPG
jgi:O-methyltransferase involved in polyketide biosynthesis